jgi:hypothetical protein
VLVRIPHSAASRGAKTWALLIRRISPASGRGLRMFEGTHLRTGSEIEESELRPTLALSRRGHIDVGNVFNAVFIFESEPVTGH